MESITCPGWNSFTSPMTITVAITARFRSPSRITRPSRCEEPPRMFHQATYAITPVATRSPNGKLSAFPQKAPR